MSMDEYEDCFVFRCDGCGLTAEFQRGGSGSFMACVGEIKDRGWRIGRDQYGDWDHRCGRCKAKASDDLLNKPFGGSKLQRVK